MKYHNSQIVKIWTKTQLSLCLDNIDIVGPLPGGIGKIRVMFQIKGTPFNFQCLQTCV